MNAGGLLPIHLSAAVPLLVAELRLRGGPDEADYAIIQETGRELAAKGDRLLYPCGKRGEAADLLRKLAYAITVLSFLPGGVTVFGQHWETEKELGKGEEKR